MSHENQYVGWQLVLRNLMESVLLGLAAPAAVGTAGSLLERSLETVGKPFAAFLHAITATPSKGEDASPATIEGLHDNLKTLREELAASIEKVLKSAGVDLTDPITIRISPADGHLEVVGDHPQKALVESALAGNRDLADNFTELAALQEVLEAGKELNESDSNETVALGEVDQDEVTAVFTANSQEGAMLEFN
jgi:hypothetical protein